MSASSGSATIAFWRVQYFAAAPSGPGAISAQINVSNISAYDVQVTLRLYDKDGNAIGSFSGLTITPVGSLTSCNATNNSCTLAAGKSAAFRLQSSSFTVDTEAYGHGTLEWSSTGTDNPTVALVADGEIKYHLASEGSASRRNLLINSGQPF